MALFQRLLMPTVRVSILSDDKIFFEGLRRILAGEGSLFFVRLSEHTAPALAVRTAGVRVLLLDARMNDAFGICRLLNDDAEGPSVIMVQLTEGEASAGDALAAGARGMLPRSASPEDVSKAVVAVFNGAIWAPRDVIVAQWLRSLKRAAVERAEPQGATNAPLTARELQVLHCAAAGLGNKEVAEALTISEATVKVHLTRIFQKLGVHGRARLAAVYHNVTPPDVRVEPPVVTPARRPA